MRRVGIDQDQPVDRLVGGLGLTGHLVSYHPAEGISAEDIGSAGLSRARGGQVGARHRLHAGERLALRVQPRCGEPEERAFGFDQPGQGRQPGQLARKAMNEVERRKRTGPPNCH